MLQLFVPSEMVVPSIWLQTFQRRELCGRKMDFHTVLWSRFVPELSHHIEGVTVLAHIVKNSCDALSPFYQVPDPILVNLGPWDTSYGS